MQVGDYQISNLLIGAVLFTTVAGLGIATGAAGSVADVVSDTFVPGGNATQAPDADPGSSEIDQNTDTDDSQNTDDGGGSSDSTDSTVSSDSGGSSDSDGGSTDSTSTKDSETGDDQDNQENVNQQQDSQQQDNQQQDSQQQDNQQQDSQQQDNQQDNDGNIQTSASIASPSNGQIYNTASVDITATVEAANASYEVRLDDSLKQSGQLNGTKDISSTLSVSDGTHNIKVLVKRSGETLVSKKAQFSVSTSSTNTSGSASISLFDPSSQTYSTNTVPLSVSLDASDASYQVNVDGVTKTSGSVDGSKTLDQDLNIVSGSHNLEVVINDSTGTLASDSVSFTVDTGDTGTQRIGFYSPDNLTAGGTALVRLYNDQGDPVEGTTVTVGSLGDFTTNQFGEIEFQVPFQETITASSTNYEKTYDITQTASEPDITLVNPVDTESFDTPTGTSRDVTFEADVDITENSGTASLIIDGSQAYTKDLSSGTNSISNIQALSGGTHNWQIDVDTPEYDVSSSSRSLTVNEVEVQNGLSLSRDPVAEESVTVQLYQDNEPVEGETILVNGNDYGQTDSSGELIIQVPNEQEITISTETGIDEITKTVEGYTEPEPEITLNSPGKDVVVDDFKKEFDFSVSAPEEGFEATLIVDGERRYTELVSGNSEGFKQSLIVGNSGNHEWSVEVKQNGEVYQSNSKNFSTTKDIPYNVDLLTLESSENYVTYEKLINISYTAKFGNNLTVRLDGHEIYNEEYPYGAVDNIASNYSLKPGTHNLDITTEIKDYHKNLNKSIKFSTSEEMPVAETEFIFYNKFGKNRIRYEVKPMEGSTLESKIENVNTGNVTTLRTKEFSETSYPARIEPRYFDDTIDVNPSKYDFFVEMESTERSETYQSEKYSLD